MEAATEAPLSLMMPAAAETRRQSSRSQKGQIQPGYFESTKEMGLSKRMPTTTMSMAVQP